MNSHVALFTAQPALAGVGPTHPPPAAAARHTHPVSISPATVPADPSTRFLHFGASPHDFHDPQSWHSPSMTNILSKPTLLVRIPSHFPLKPRHSNPAFPSFCANRVRERRRGHAWRGLRRCRRPPVRQAPVCPRCVLDSARTPDLIYPITFRLLIHSASPL